MAETTDYITCTLKINALRKYVEMPDDTISTEIQTNPESKLWVLSPSKKWRTCYILDTRPDEYDTKWLVHYNGFHTQYDEWICKDSERISFTKPQNVTAWWISSYCVPSIGFVYDLKGTDPSTYQYIISSLRNPSLQPDIHIGSELLAINGTPVADLGFFENVNNYLNEVVETLYNENVDISLKFRIDKHLLAAKGVHLQFDIMFESVDEEHRFPYYRFNKEAIQPLIQELFTEKIKIYQIYGNEIQNGVSVLIFVYITDKSIYKFEKQTQKAHISRQQLIVNGFIRKSVAIDILIPMDIIHLFCCFYSQQKRFYKNIQLQNKAQKIQQTMSEVLSTQCIAKYVQQRYGIRDDQLDRGYANTFHMEYMKEKTSLMNLIYAVKGVDGGRNAWYLVLVDPDKFKNMQNLLKQSIIHLDKIGYILRSAYGVSPSTEEQNACFDMFDFTKD